MSILVRADRGAYYRRDGIPGEWIRRLASSERIEEIAAALYAAGPGRECGHSARPSDGKSGRYSKPRTVDPGGAPRRGRSPKLHSPPGSIRTGGITFAKRGDAGSRRHDVVIFHRARSTAVAGPGMQRGSGCPGQPAATATYSVGSRSGRTVGALRSATGADCGSRSGRRRCTGSAGGSSAAISAPCPRSPGRRAASSPPARTWATRHGPGSSSPPGSAPSPSHAPGRPRAPLSPWAPARGHARAAGVRPGPTPDELSDARRARRPRKRPQPASSLDAGNGDSGDDDSEGGDSGDDDSEGGDSGDDDSEGGDSGDDDSGDDDSGDADSEGDDSGDDVSGDDDSGDADSEGDDSGDDVSGDDDSEEGDSDGESESEEAEV